MQTLQIRDRDGDMVTVHDPNQPHHPCICLTDTPGWGPDTPDGRARPCLHHREHLIGAFGPGRRVGAQFRPARGR